MTSARHRNDEARERPSALSDAELHAVFPGDSEMAARCRAFDWAATPLGPVAQWSHSLRTTVGIVLTSRQPMFLWWSPELVQIYNDAYRPSLGTGGRADRALGARGKEFWTEIWDAIGPQIEQVMAGGASTWHENQHLPIERNGRLEDVWWTYSYSPVRDDDGSIAATLVVCQETTGRVLADRARQAALEALAAEQARLREIVDLSPAFIAVLRGPEHRYERANVEYERLVGGRPLIGRTVAEALPEVVEQGFIRLLDRVLQTGEPYVGRAVPVRLIRASGSLLELRYVDFVYQALTEADGTRSGVFVHGVDVTVSVEGRREAEAARADAEEARERTARLQALTEALARARSLDDVARIVVADVVTALGARTGALSSRAADGDDALTLVRTVGFPDDVADLVRRQSLDQRTPLVECYLSGAPVWIESRDGPAGLDARYPSIAPVWEALGVKSAAFLPLVAAGEVVGVISFSFEGPHVFQPAERAFLLTLGQQAALAMERARLFGALATERERLRSLIRDMPAPVALHLGPEHRIAILSDAFRSIARGRDITGMTPREAYPEVIGQGIIEQFDEVFTTGRAWISPETHARFDRRGTGVEDTWFDIRYLPVRDADGQVAGVLNFSFDVTEQVRARHEVERLLAVSEASRADAEAARAEAEAANRAKSEFLATMSHELRTPLNAIGGYAELIELGIHGPVSDAQRTALDRIQASQRHLLGLIAGVLDYSRVEAGAVSYRLVNVPVAEAVAEAEVLVSPQLRAKGLGYAWAGAPAELAVRADREKLQQILLNLLGNAVKFTNPRDETPGRIEVSCSTRGEGADARVCIHVRDTGEGIEPEKLEHVFEPFVQVDQRLTRPHAGVGLGLAISRDLARGMGGDLTAESELGTGSIFTLTLPRAYA